MSDKKVEDNNNSELDAKQKLIIDKGTHQQSKQNNAKAGRRVYYMLSLKNVYKIDLPNQTFHASLGFDFRWLPSEEELTSDLLDKDGHLTRQPKFQPVNKFYEKMNALDLLWEYKEVKVREIRDAGEYCMFLGQHLSVKGEFFNNFDLRNYPSDTQSLTIGFKIRKSHMVLVPLSFGGIDFFKVAEFVFSKAYFYTNAMVEQGVRNEPEKTRGTASYYYLYITMKVTRNPLDFVLRHCSWLLLFSFATFGVYTISSENIGERMTYLVTIILIFSAYSIVLSGELPEVPYYTNGDKLILCHTGFVFTATVLIGIGSPELLEFGEKTETSICIFLFVV